MVLCRHLFLPAVHCFHSSSSCPLPPPPFPSQFPRFLLLSRPCSTRDGAACLASPGGPRARVHAGPRGRRLHERDSPDGADPRGRQQPDRARSGAPSRGSRGAPAGRAPLGAHGEAAWGLGWERGWGGRDLGGEDQEVVVPWCPPPPPPPPRPSSLGRYGERKGGMRSLCCKNGGFKEAALQVG